MKHLISLLVLTAAIGATAAFAQPVVSITDSTVNCAGSPSGKLIASATSGSSPYSYVWYNSSWGMVNSGTQHWPSAYGTYHVIVTDNASAKDTATVTISHSPFSFDLTPVDQYGIYHVSCPGSDGQVLVEVTGGTGPYCIQAFKANGQQIDTCITGTSVTLTGMADGDCRVFVATNGGNGCGWTQSTWLEKTPHPLIRLEGELYDNGHYVSCDTCADARFTMSAQGAHGEASFTWIEVTEGYYPDIFVDRASLAIPFSWKDGHEPPWDEYSWMLSAQVGASVEDLQAETWYMTVLQDELNCYDYRFLWIEKPRPAAGAWHTTGNTADETTVLGTVNGEPLRLATNDTVRVTIAADGAVGIGTDEVPEGYLMAVNGRIIAEEIEVKLNGDWPDFVFEEGYPLPPLDSVNGFIQQNGHLPGFPSASQMQQRGSIASGQMVTALVQKVEELTLYVIQLQQQVQALQKQGAQMDIKVRGLGHAISNAGGNGNGNPGGPGNGNPQGGN